MPIILKSQIFALVEDHTEVERELDNLKRGHKIKIFKVIGGLDEFLIVFIEDFNLKLQKIQKQQGLSIAGQFRVRLFEKFETIVLPKATDSFVSKQRLLDLLGGVETDMDTLVSSGFLILGREEGVSLYWFSIPNIGQFLSFCHKGRRELLQLFKRQRNSEILLQDLEEKRLHRSPLGTTFHLRELLGKEFIEKVDTTAGPLYRLRRDVVL